ncbi:dephospho-CoA kinase [Photobacterium angustum]|uniref:Dephospho-CoA kinase n=1 Tax=Photobacterium angustum TaxID=661 RepID=A0A855SAX5_PHOAN|nr:dephospho-CoA kinase [Photobacterium angustum]KJF81190.1 dephospho-CoA kinase [Photobacterium damselae subsp. damselae]KJG16719.1 dephospho-CoA kinase [Photobacterium angustum]KJG22990.1 dephospho-CoA kinase [Photobacterium angustum]KJG29959.1 dephospho-CoA kinase [Photobacterium angustum]KJG39340.1 dephospho-CoA kinase [Photobacterium angustum]
MSIVIGLTGGIGSGKTTVANLFADNYGIDIIDADIVAREVVEPNTAGLNAIIKKFGADILLEDGTLNRAKLREAIFSQPELKQWLNELLHPLIREKMLHDIKLSKSPYCLLVVPLMVENNLQTLTNRLLVVDVDEQTQIERTQQRDNVSVEQIKNILASQATRQQRLDAADDVIINFGDSPALTLQIAQLHRQYLKMDHDL